MYEYGIRDSLSPTPICAALTATSLVAACYCISFKARKAEPFRNEAKGGKFDCESLSKV